GNPIACAAGLALLKELRGKKLAANAAKQGALLMEGLKALQSAHPHLIRSVRGRGLMIALQLNQPSLPFVLSCLQQGLIVNATAGTVLRLLPPLNLGAAEAKQALAVLKKVFEKPPVHKAPAATA
ncbi:MAG TPA: aminotransferase class III-fold pyridoxal phosphate-dependent enzyme, partial [bacterium]|nr:aminotransferase class III-fold pyridoxal phosphate-dependent enzyme [bacterium]